MSEPMEAPPKPFTTTSYVFLTTLWVFLLPSLVVNTPFLLFNLFAEVERTHITTVLYGAAFLLGGVVFFAYACLLLFWRFTANHRARQVPGSFVLWVLPFWMPFFWGLAVTTVCLSLAPLLSPGDLHSSLAVAYPQFFLPFGVVLAFVGNVAFVLTASNTVTLFCAIAGTVYVSRLASPSCRKDNNSCGARGIEP